MILTVTPNPSIDLLFSATHLVWDDANRIESPRRRAGGQGINLTRAAHVLGGQSMAVALLGGRTGADLQALLELDRIPCEAVAIEAETRTFVAVRESATGRSLLLNSRGPHLEQRHRDRLLACVQRICKQEAPRWLVCAGSIPRGIDSDLYAALARLARERSIQFVADCDGDALDRAVRAGCDLLAPNQHEAGRLLSRTITTVTDAADAARSLLSVAPRVLIKLAEKGAVFAQPEGCWHAVSENIETGSAVGAGDAFLAAFLVAEMSGMDAQQSLRSAVAAGSAVLLSTGADLLSRADYEEMLAQTDVAPA